MRKVVLAVLIIVGLGAALIPLALFLDTDDRPAPDRVPGFAAFDLPVPHRENALTAVVWYPSTVQSQPVVIGQNALFYGHHIHPDAPFPDTPKPLIVMSHGSGGNAVQMGWLAGALANAGYIVAAVNHAGTTSRDSDPHRTPHIWDRARDLTVLIDHMLVAEGLPAVDPNRIGALGFSLGGFSALAVAGARVSKQAFIDYCDRHAGQLDCGWMQAAGVDFTAIDQTLYEADYRDPRIGAVAVIDPALPQAMVQDSLRALQTETLLINLGTPDAVPVAMRADAVSALIPGSAYLSVPGSAHFSALAECSTLGTIVIGLSGEENICSDRGLRPRGQVHADLQAAVTAFFIDSLPTAQIAN